MEDAAAVSITRIAARHGLALNPAPLLAHWGVRLQGRPGVETTYPWTLPFDAAPGSMDYAMPGEMGRLWRPREADAYMRDPTAYGHRLQAPVVLADVLEYLGELADGPDEHAATMARRVLDDVRPRVERDVAAFVQGDDPWRDTFLLWLLASRPRAGAMLEPLARAIATRYATMADWTAGLVCGIRYPFDGTPLVSASAHLALGLWTLGYNPRALPGLLRYIDESRGPTGGWADDGQPEDILTTLAAADLLAHVDPGFDPAPTADLLARYQEPAGWWRALDPETPWLTGAVIEFLVDADRPFHERFRWPGYDRASRDRRTRLPWWAAFGDVMVRTFERVPGLATARTDLAFIDLAGFGAFNTRFGQARGDEVLRVLGRVLADLPFSHALRDGGDEFIVIGTPGHDGLDAALERFRDDWPRTFAAAFPDAGAPVATRMVVASATGSTIEAARARLGRAIGEVKAAHREPTERGVLVRI